MNLISFEEAYKLVTDSKWSPNEAEFRVLFNRVRRKQPAAIIEVGTSSGSSCLMLHHAWPDARIYSLDIQDKVKYDPSKEIGYTAKGHVDAARVRFIRGCMGEVFFGDTIDLIYIDANHKMPCATLDFIYALPFCRSPFEFISHDIEWAKDSPDPTEEGADYLWKVIKTLGTNIEREKYLGCATLEFSNYYDFARELLKHTIINGQLDTQNEKF